MDSFVIKTAFKMGEHDEKYGQTWYATVEGLEVPVMFNLMSGTVQELDKISFETQEIHKFKSGKNQGKEYRRLKKVRVQESGQARQVTTEQVQGNDTLAKLEARVKKLEEAVFQMEDRNDDSAKDEVTLDDDEPIDIDSIPF